MHLNTIRCVYVRMYVHIYERYIHIYIAKCMCNTCAHMHVCMYNKIVTVIKAYLLIS